MSTGSSGTNPTFGAIVIPLIRACEEIDEWGGHLARLRRHRRRKRLVSGFAGTRARRPRHSIFQFLDTP